MMPFGLSGSSSLSISIGAGVGDVPLIQEDLPGVLRSHTVSDPPSNSVNNNRSRRRLGAY